VWLNAVFGSKVRQSAHFRLQYDLDPTRFRLLLDVE
jgi:hypothetical protein